MFLKHINKSFTSHFKLNLLSIFLMLFYSNVCNGSDHMVSPRPSRSNGHAYFLWYCLSSLMSDLETISAPSSCTVLKPGQTTHGGRLQLEFFKAALFILKCFTQSFFFTCLLCCHCRTKKPFIFKHKKWPSGLSPFSCSLPARHSVHLKQSAYFWKLN